jgi:hypothetical protein
MFCWTGKLNICFYLDISFGISDPGSILKVNSDFAEYKIGENILENFQLKSIYSKNSLFKLLKSLESIFKMISYLLKNFENTIRKLSVHRFLTSIISHSFFFKTRMYYYSCLNNFNYWKRQSFPCMKIELSHFVEHTQKKHNFF